MSIDVNAYLHVSGGKRIDAPGNEKMEVGVYVISRTGEQLHVFRVPSEAFSNNNALGGPDMKTLFTWLEMACTRYGPRFVGCSARPG